MLMTVRLNWIYSLIMFISHSMVLQMTILLFLFDSVISFPLCFVMHSCTRHYITLHTVVCSFLLFFCLFQRILCLVRQRENKRKKNKRWQIYSDDFFFIQASVPRFDAFVLINENFVVFCYFARSFPSPFVQSSFVECHSTLQKVQHFDCFFIQFACLLHFM